MFIPQQVWNQVWLCRSDPAVVVGFWSRVLLPQILGQELPPLANQKATPSKPVPKLSAACLDSALNYMQETLDKNTRFEAKPSMVRLGPVEGDSKGYWALKASDTPFLHAAKIGIDTQVAHGLLLVSVRNACMCWLLRMYPFGGPCWSLHNVTA